MWPRIVLYLVSSAVPVLYRVPGCPTSINHISISCATPLAVYLQRAICLFSFLLPSSSPSHPSPSGICSFAQLPVLSVVRSWNICVFPRGVPGRICIFSHCDSGGQVQFVFRCNTCRCCWMWMCACVCVWDWGKRTHTHTHGQKQKLTLLPSHFPSAEAASAMSIFTGEQLREHGSNVNARISIWSELWVHEWVSEQDTERERERERKMRGRGREGDTVNHLTAAGSLSNITVAGQWAGWWGGSEKCVKLRRSGETHTVRDRRERHVISHKLSHLISKKKRPTI